MAFSVHTTDTTSTPRQHRISWHWLYVLHAAVLLALVLATPLDADEAVFLEAAHRQLTHKQTQYANDPLRAYASAYPVHGYGVAYWNVYVGAYALLGPWAGYAMRLLSWGCLLAIPWLVMWLSRQWHGQGQPGWLPLLWLLQPLAWQPNKLGGPEVPQMTLFLLACVLWWRPRASHWWLLGGGVALGLALGFKVHAAFFALLPVGGLLVLQPRQRFIWGIPWSLGGVLLGFVACTPATLLHPHTYLELMHAYRLAVSTGQHTAWGEVLWGLNTTKLPGYAHARAMVSAGLLCYNPLLMGLPWLVRSLQWPGRPLLALWLMTGLVHMGYILLLGGGYSFGWHYFPWLAGLFAVLAVGVSPAPIRRWGWVALGVTTLVLVPLLWYQSLTH